MSCEFEVGILGPPEFLKRVGYHLRTDTFLKGPVASLVTAAVVTQQERLEYTKQPQEAVIPWPS